MDPGDYKYNMACLSSTAGWFLTKLRSRLSAKAADNLVFSHSLFINQVSTKVISLSSPFQDRDMQTLWLIKVMYAIKRNILWFIGHRKVEHKNLSSLLKR